MQQMKLQLQKGSETMENHDNHIKEWWKRQTARLVGIFIMGCKKEAALYDKISTKYIHSDNYLDQTVYRLSGEVKLNELTREDLVVVVDAWAYRQRNADGEKIRLRTGSFASKENKEQRHLKLMGIIRQSKLFIVTERANKRVMDIAPMSPVRVAGIGRAMMKFRQATAA